MSSAVIYPAGPGEWSPGDRAIAHIDMDAFFASVEILDNPELRDRPVVVGGGTNRGVVSAASYRAREFGIHSAMPIFQARRLCPDLVIRPGRMKRYSELSGEVMRVLNSFSPLVEQLSIDEACIDLTGTDKLFGRPEDTAARMKKEIFQSTSLTASIGLSTGKLVAKIASDFNKPDGITVIPPQAVREFLDSLPVGRIPGIGRKSGEQLAKIGIKKVEDLRKVPPGYLEKRFGGFGRRLESICEGDAGSPVIPWSQAKSVSNEVTLEEDTGDIEILEGILLALSEKVGRRLRKDGLKGRTVTLKLKDSGHKLATRSVTLEQPTHQGQTIYSEARKLLLAHETEEMTRLVGVGVSNLEQEGTGGQIGLGLDDASGARRWDKVDRAVDRILDRFGQGAVKRGRLHGK